MSASGSSGWRRYNIFLSSTFKDMDFERDIIKFRVIPALNRRFRDRRVELQAIDLRLGVNTSDMSEAESERKVLSVCTSCIDSARPFFIGLIGKRYGWIPPMERWQEFTSRLSAEEQALLAGTAGCSVTEMEIVYGALSQESFDTSHVLFYLRDDSSYEGLPKDLLPAFCDSDPELLRKLDALKDKVRRLFGALGGEDDRCTPYRLDWRDGHFEGDDFERTVTEQLAQQIELETAREEEAGAASWWAQEKELEESTLLRLLPGSVETYLAPDPDEKKSKEEDPSDRVAWYVPGMGASTFMAQEYASWDEDADVVRLLAVFGLSEYSNAMRPVLARWIHELALVTGREEIPDDDQLLGKLPEPELNALFASLVQEAYDADKYIYIFLDDVEALETTASKDLYMPWLDRVADQVNILVNLQDGSEARTKFLSAHAYPARMMVPGIVDSEDAEALISRYEKTYFLELPAAVRKAMLEMADDDEDCLLPIKVHNVFRLFESLTQEDFSRIRSSEGSQIDAINGYLEEIWGEMPDTPYDLMTYMVNNILYNLGLGEQMRQAFWYIAAAPGGLRESDIAHFAGADWDVVQFYRAMDFLQDFFYEDRARHLWRAKYLTQSEDGLQKRQKEISSYLLTLAPADSLRETMGLYYALKGGEASHFLPYLVEGDYLQGQMMTDLLHFHGPQMRQLAREGYFESDAFPSFCRSLAPSARLQLFMDICTGLADMQETLAPLMRGKMPDWLDDVDPASLSAEDAFTFASVVGARIDSETHVERALQAARHSVEAGFGRAQQLVSVLSGFLMKLYQQNGHRAKAEALRAEISAASGAQMSLRDRFMALYPIIHEAQAMNGPLRKKKALALLDRFFSEYYAILDSLDPHGTYDATDLFRSADLVLQACAWLNHHKEYARALQEQVRFLPWMQVLYHSEGFFNAASPVELFSYFHVNLSMSATGLLGVDIWHREFGAGDNPVQRIGELAMLATFEGQDRLKEIDPDHHIVAIGRNRHVGGSLPKTEMREILGVVDLSLAELDEKIVEYYDKYCES